MAVEHETKIVDQTVSNEGRNLHISFLRVIRIDTPLGHSEYPYILLFKNKS